MKKSLTKTAIIILFCNLFLLNKSLAAIKYSASAVCLKINGIILKSHKEERGSYKIELFNNKLKVDSSLVSVNKPFEFSLSKNLLYTIRVTKQGFVTLLIKIDTELHIENSTLYEFRFKTELRPSNKNAAEDSEMDLLAGVLKFDKEKNRFYPVEVNEDLNNNNTESASAKSFSPIEKSSMYATCLRLNGLILKSPKEEKGFYKVELILDNSVVDIKYVSVNTPFEYNLIKNSWYTLRITKEDFVPLLISIDTQLDSENSTLYEFNFETELYHNSSVNTIDKLTFDLPIGLINYDASNNRFYPTTEYRTHIPGSF